MAGEMAGGEGASMRDIGAQQKKSTKSHFHLAGGMGGQPWRLGALLLAASVAVAALVGSFSLPVRGSPVPRPGRRTHALRNTRTKTMARAP